MMYDGEIKMCMYYSNCDIKSNNLDSLQCSFNFIFVNFAQIYDVANCTDCKC